jgi:hypothetical protein
MLESVLDIHACALSAHTRVRMPPSASATHLWLLPHRCPFPELGPLTQTFPVSLCYTRYYE